MKKKINLQLIGISVLAVVVTTLVMFRIFYDVYRDQVRDDLETVAQTLKDTHIFQEGNQTGYYFNADTLRVTWVGADGNVLYDNSADETNMENHAARPEIRDAFRYGSGESVRESETLNRSTYYYALRLDDGSVLRVSQDEENVWSIANNMIPAIAAMMAFMVILCIVLARILTRSIIDPIEEMAVNIDDYSIAPAYKELVPFAQLIRKQHADILGAAKMRQDFTANVSHELKTPLTAISGYAELMENGMVGADEVASFSSKIRQNVERLLSLINDTIRLSELDNGMTQDIMETFDLNELAERCVDNLKMYAHKNEVNIACIGVSTCITANKEMIAELIDNLCNNAIRYNNKNGSVMVEVGTHEGHAFLRVKDTGIGIPKEHQERVFERFYRVDKSRSKQTGGTGLGLAIVKHVVAIHNASLSLESEEGKGTEITVTF
ncbi:ATP-binding protein [Eubacterium sp. An3]|uniref:sensor histidine kinase n=1 Tax=Eubacterium sp. An3 TaxID=1965628 RepID=UPI000B396D64|nr:ATP-binding protein [Eubacterium sp. An3]OUO30151.1 two-component sensor histidine kinase [Eubacterium sp. An3]